MSNESKGPVIHKVTRRAALIGMAGAAGAAIVQTVSGRVIQQAPAAVPDDPTKVQGAPPSARGQRSPFENPQREYGRHWSLTPLEDLYGTITPSDLHYERHHGGVPLIDPEKYELLIHGMVDRPMTFTLADLKRSRRSAASAFWSGRGICGRRPPRRAGRFAPAGRSSIVSKTGPEDRAGRRRPDAGQIASAGEVRDRSPLR